MDIEKLVKKLEESDELFDLLAEYWEENDKESHVISTTLKNFFSDFRISCTIMRKLEESLKKRGWEDGKSRHKATMIFTEAQLSFAERERSPFARLTSH